MPRGDRLADPPGRVGGELVALGVVELLDRADQAGVALLDQVEHGHLAAAVLAGDRDDEAEVGVDEPLHGALALLDEPLQLGLGGVLGRAALLAADTAFLEQLRGEQAGLDGLGELDLGGRVEQRRTRDLVEVEADAVAALDLTLVTTVVVMADMLPSYRADRSFVVLSGPTLRDGCGDSRWFV